MKVASKQETNSIFAAFLYQQNQASSFGFKTIKYIKKQGTIIEIATAKASYKNRYSQIF